MNKLKCPFYWEGHREGFSYDLAARSVSNDAIEQTSYFNGFSDGRKMRDGVEKFIFENKLENYPEPINFVAILAIGELLKSGKKYPEDFTTEKSGV